MIKEEAKAPKRPKKQFDLLLNALREKERQEVKTKAIQWLLQEIKNINEDFDYKDIDGNKKERP